MRIPNLTETVAAQEKASELNERFADWVWAEPDRAASLARLYNDTFNAIVLRNYDGAHRQFPGLAVTIELREHQVAAVVRMLSEPTVLLAHEVGAGKTLEMIVGCMELRRLGMAQKPAVVVPTTCSSSSPANGCRPTPKPASSPPTPTTSPATTAGCSSPASRPATGTP
jgi:N12 class adenine-specific DNA methylase